MKRLRKRNQSALTLIELSATIGIMLMLSGVGVLGTTWWSGYRDQLNAETALNIVAGAQREYLLTNPTQTYSSITTTNLLTYLPGGVMPSSMPTGASVSVSVFPPTATKGSKTWAARDY